MDFVVEHLRERYPDPSQLVIATNYEAHPLMFHLGSRVIVGLAGNDLVAERELVPDVVIPRRRWPRRLPELARFLRRGEYEEVVLPVQDVHYNDIPSLSRWPSTPDPHRFETPLAGRPREPAARVRAGGPAAQLRERDAPRRAHQRGSQSQQRRDDRQRDPGARTAFAQRLEHRRRRRRPTARRAARSR